MDFYMEMITTREFPGRCHSRPLLDLISQPKTASYNLRNALTNLHFVSGQRLKNHQKNAIDFMLKYETEGFEERFWINFDACTNTSYCSEGNYEISTNRQTLQYCPTWLEGSPLTTVTTNDVSLFSSFLLGPRRRSTIGR